MTLGNDNGTDGQTDRQTDGQTDIQSVMQYADPSYGGGPHNNLSYIQYSLSGFVENEVLPLQLQTTTVIDGCNR